jgi:flavodoxin
MMKAIALYGSSRGNTKLVANRLAEKVSFALDVIDVATISDLQWAKSYDLLIFLSSTWGDGELQEDMENFFTGNKLDLQGRHYALCELGNYYGYDDFEFGALRVMQCVVAAANGVEFHEPFCMDSYPRKDWEGFDRWIASLNTSVSKYYA